MQQNDKDSLERDLISTGISELVKELRYHRRSKKFWRLFIVILLGISIFASIISGMTNNRHENHPHTALIDVKGTIVDNASASAEHVIHSLEAAFKNANTRGIILLINSPGGSTVQASYIYNAIRRLRHSHKNIPIYSVCSDICTSAAYYIASATDEIYVNPLSLVGSIGVLAEGFGYVDILAKLGIERRLFTAGEDKAIMDAFSPLSKHAEDELQILLKQTHQYFIHDVQQGRGKRLKHDPALFSGRVWLGEDAKNLGLIDHFGSASDVARHVIKQNHIVDYTIKPSYFEQIANQFSTELVTILLQSIGTHARTTIKGISL